MDYYGMDTEVVQGTGKNVFDLEPDAHSAVKGVLGSYLEAAGAVHHPVVKQALSTYHDTHQKGHLAFPTAVRNLGSNTAGGGRAIADGQNEATNVQKDNAAHQQALAKDINQPLA